MKKQKSTLGIFVVFIILEWIFLFPGIQLTRNFFSPSKILQNEKTTVGYAQYTGYPVYYDTIVYTGFMAAPLIFLFILRKISQQWK